LLLLPKLELWLFEGPELFPKRVPKLDVLLLVVEVLFGAPKLKGALPLLGAELLEAVAKGAVVFEVLKANGLAFVVGAWFELNN